MAGVCSLVRRAGRLHFMAGTSKIVTTTLPSSKSAALATAEATASRIAGPRECPASTATKPPPEPRVQRLTFRSGGLPRRLWYFWYAHAEYRLP
jgi:hypothetical protein